MEKEEILQLVDENIHHQVLNAILKKLPNEKHEEFLLALYHRPTDKNLLEELKKDIENIEEIITQEVTKVKAEILTEIKRGIKIAAHDRIKTTVCAKKLIF